MDSPTPPLPTFLIIGAQKSATRWLRSNLGKHPDVYAAPLELSFFNQKYRRGLDFYRSEFDGWNGEPVVGEATPGYMMARHRPARVAKRIKETVPDIRLIVVLRDPIDRAQSAMIHHVKRGRLKKRSKLVQVATTRDPVEDRLCLISGGWYSESLEPYVELFGDQLLVVLYDDIRDDPKWVYQSALEHVGASSDFVPPDLDEVVFSNQQNRKSGVSLADRQQLWPFFEEDVKKLEPMIARDLSAWDPTPDRFRWPSPPEALVDLQHRTMDWVEGVVANVEPAQYDLPTPCPDWNVRELLVHMVGLVLVNALSCAPPGGETPAIIHEVGDADPAVGYRMASELLREATQDPAPLRQALLVPAGMLPTVVQVAGNLVNQLGHGWDLAVATGQDATIPAELASPIGDFARELYDRAPVLRETLADERPVDPDASESDRFIAFLGRDPTIAAHVRPS